MERESGPLEARETPVDSANARTQQTAEAPDAIERSAVDAERRAEEEHRRAEGYLALLKRERADFTNYKRRVEQERAEQAQLATEGLILSLLPTLDDLERALAGIPLGETDVPWVNGIRLIERSLRSALERGGLERIGAEGARFDPRLHEALLQDDAPDRPEGEVVRELRPGYVLGDRVLRPAQVSVARGAVRPSGEPSAPPAS